MSVLKKLCFFISVLYLVNLINAHSLRDPYICGQPQCDPDGKFKYNTLVSYRYNYNVTVNTLFSGTSENRSTLNIGAEVILDFLSPCEGVLKLDKVIMRDLDENYQQEREDNFAAEITNYKLRFAFQNGVITEICPHFEEPDWVLNFKRGILSLFQNSMTRFDMDFIGIEQDVHGNCNTEYYMQGQENTGLIILKKKDLTQCVDRFKYLSILQTVRYNFQSKFQTWPVLESDSQCHITIDHNVYTSVSCNEKHLIEPFSGKQSGAITTVTQDLVMTEEVNKTISNMMDDKSDELDKINLRHSLLHNHIPVAKSSVKELKSARDILKEICRLEESYINSDASHDGKPTDESDQMLSGITVALWGNLVQACRGLQHGALQQLLIRSNTICRQGKKYILDALPYIASVGSVQMIKNMTIKGTIDENTRQEWLMSMAMIPRPQKEMIISMGELLKLYPTDKSISFATSAMVHSYCRNSKETLTECCKEKQNRDIIKLFEHNVLNILAKGSKILNRTERDTIIISIKSLGNMGGFSNDFRDYLTEVIEDKYLPLSIRVHTVDAFRRTPCIEMRNYFLELFREESMDVEVRLASYLQVMRCPEYTTIREILHILKNEKINQVASFVWSHLENLEKSTIPSRVEKQGLLSSSNIPKPKKTPDIRKFSRNYEHGIFFDQYNTGGNYEANVIMSPDSYIPRSVSLNLTVDMFGESINVLELKARGEGFEQYAENILKTSTFFNQKKVDKALSALRITRSPNEADNINKKVDTIDYKNEALNHRFPMLDLGMKVFGNEISFWSAEGDKEIKDAMKQINPLHHIKRIFSGKRIAYKKASLFLDTTYSVPTGCGLPMKLNMMGTSIANLNMSGSISDIENFWKTKSIDFEGIMYPSMALGIVTTMSVDGGGFVGTGIRVNLNVHTATALSANLHLEEGKHATLQISLPHSKQEIFEARSELIVMHGQTEVKQMGYNKDKVESSICSWPIVHEALGIKICASYEFPNMTNLVNPPYFILAGPAWYLLSLEKVDPSAKVYVFSYSWEHNNTASIFGLSFDTPNSKIKRMFNTSISNFGTSGRAMMSFQSADNFLSAHGTFKNLPDLKSFECVLNINGRKHFDAVMSLSKQDQKNGYMIIPKLYIAVNNEKISELAGSLHFTNKKGVSQYDVNLEFQTKKLASRLIGYITWNGPSKGAKLRLDYKFLNERKQTVRMDALISNKDVNQRKDFYGELGLDFSSYPHLNFYTNCRYKGNQNHMELNYNLSTSRQVNSENVTFHYSYSRHATNYGYKLHHHFKTIKPYLDVNFNYVEDDGLSLFGVTIGYDKINHLGGQAGVWGKLYTPKDTKFYLEAELNATMPTFTPMKFHLNLHEKIKNEFHISAEGVWFTGIDAKIAALYQDLTTLQSSSRRLKAVITSKKFETIGLDLKIVQDNKQINVHIRGDQGVDQYGFIGKYIHFSPYNISCFGQFDFKSKMYSVNVIANILNDINIITNIHLDHIRDIHITYMKINRPKVKKLNANINWDANRDPSKKLSVGVELLDKGPLNYSGIFKLFYPGRLINGEFDVLVKDWLCNWLVKLGWSPDDNIYWRVKMFSEINNETVYALLSEMDTPFKNWRNTNLNLIWRYIDNFQSLDGNMTWEKERIVIGLLSNYLFKTNEVFGEISTIINSSLAALPSINAVARHRHVWKKSSDTYLSFEYNNDGLMMVNSSWKLDKMDNANKPHNINGRVAMKSPFNNYKFGLLVTEISFGNGKNVKGLTHVNLEDRIYTIVVDGYSKRFTNSMLYINVTSPIPAYSLMVGRFGFIDTDRHLVAMIKMPNFSIGAEGLIKLTSSQDFHVYGNLAIPVDFFRNTMLQAKRNSEEVDFRVGFEKMEFGFTGIWHYKSKSDFQYLYKLFTPLQEFEENGLVFKNIIKDGLDSEVSIRLSKHKVGVAMLIRENGQGILKMINDKYYGAQKKRRGSDQLVEDFSNDILLAVDTLYYETIKLTASLNKFDNLDEDEIINVKGNLKLPANKELLLTNKLIITDLTTMINDLHVTTPYKSYSEIKFINDVNIIMGEKYNMSYIVYYKNNDNWIENSLKFYYEHNTREDEELNNYIATVYLITQLESLAYLNGTVDISTEDTITRLTANVDLPSCHIKSQGQLEIEESFIDTSCALNITSPYLEPYNLHMKFKKEFSDTENVILGGLQIQTGLENNYLKTEIFWHPNSTDYLKVKARGSLIPILPPSDMVMEFNKKVGNNHMVLRAEARVGSIDMAYSLDAEQRNNLTTLRITSPHRGFRKVSFVNEIKGSKTNGAYIGDSVTYNITGDIKGVNPIEAVAVLRPTTNAETFTLSLRSFKHGENHDLIVTLIGRVQFTIQAFYKSGKNFKDFYAKLDSSNQHFDEIFIKSRLNLTDDNKVKFALQAMTPFQKIQAIDVNTEILLTSKTGDIICNYNLTSLSGESDLKWSLHGDNIYVKAFNYHVSSRDAKKMNFNTYYKSNDKDPIDIGFYVNLNEAWRIGANASALVKASNVSMALVNVLLPQPNLDVHTFQVQIDAKPQSVYKSIELSYNTDVTKNVAKGYAKLYNVENDLSFNVSMEYGNPDKMNIIDNILHAKLVKNGTVQLNYALVSPLFKNEETLKMLGIYNEIKKDLLGLSGTIFYPASKQITDFKVNYGGWKYSVANFNTSTPFDNLPWLASDARFSNKPMISENIVKLYWPNNTAAINSTEIIRKSGETTTQSGVIVLEIPLNTKHLLESNYNYEESKEASKGNIVMLYNHKQFIEGKFKRVSDRGENNLLRDNINIDIDNTYKPLGIHYVHQYSNTGINDIRQASIYDLKNSSNFNLTGRIDVEPWNSGKLIKLMAIQENRTLRFENHFESKAKEVYQGSKIIWTPEIWFLYNVHVYNKTKFDDESQELKLNIEYPDRSFGIFGLYNLKPTALDGTTILDWVISGDNKTVKLTGHWDNPDLVDINQHNIKIALSHPSFKKDVSLQGKYSSDSITVSNMSAILEYSNFENERFTFDSMFRDDSVGSNRNYKFLLDCKHPATNLDLTVDSKINLKQSHYYIDNYFKHQKSLFNETVRQGKLILNLQDHTVVLEQTRDEDWYLINGRWHTVYPEYKVHFTVNKTTGNDTGMWVLSIKDRSTMAHYNRSNDVSYHLIGQINDARSADLNAWRDFDDVKTVDLSSYIRLNHSKLLTSKIIWRPEMYQQLKNYMSFHVRDFYQQTNEILSMIKKMPMETHSTVKSIWADAKPRVKELLNDLNDLHVIKDDIDEFQYYLNNSYNENEFYIKNIVEFSINMMDELSLRNHIESLPEIVNEIWQIMGDTGTSLRQSILWIIESIKSSYAQFMDRVNKILDGDLMDQVADLMEAAILQYDTFIKHVHVEFISYCEAMWKNALDKFGVFWKNVLKTIEPTYIHIAHYVESYTFQFGTEILDFFYARTNELTDTPFFGLLSQFAQDVDKFWKDIHNEDAINNIKKYSSKFYNFVKTKILVHIPFQKEMQDISSELFNEVNKLQQLTLIKTIKAKFWEARDRLQWWYDYFNVGNILKYCASTIYQKAVEMPRTAIQVEESHRIPKTNFVFDPRKGVLLLEQKLPMPWHAFNRTPDFSEIPEYRFVRKIVDTLVLSNVSLLSYYYEFKLYTDVCNLFPPFAGHTVMNSLGTVVTFDNKIFSVKEAGMYLLAADFWTRNFTIMMKSNRRNEFDLVLLTKRNLIFIDLSSKTVTVDNMKTQTLPIVIDNWTIQRNYDKVNIQNMQGVVIKCNYLFKTCTFDIDGTYFARLGGLFGTMNHESYDDMLTPNGEITTTEKFVRSWKVFKGGNQKITPNLMKINDSVCESYFRSSVSPLKTCFPLIAPSEFYEECMSGLDPCILANTYVKLCTYNQIPLRLPVKCMSCTSPKGTVIDEATFVEINDIPNTTDIVFVVEAHPCNKNMRRMKNIDLFVETLENKLIENGHTNNKYSVLVFGGSKIYGSAQSLYMHDKLFVGASEIAPFFNHIEIDSNMNMSKYKADTFEALGKASELNFRPGVSKIFILYSCSKCDYSSYNLDYTVIHQVLMDSSITLHMVMNDAFTMTKRRMLKTLYGVDRNMAFTSKDIKDLTGDTKLRHLVSFPKQSVGFCASLAFESNGTLFTANKMNVTDNGGGRKAVTVMANRVATFSNTCSLVRCECHDSRLKCSMCPRRLPTNLMDEIEDIRWDSKEIEDYIDLFLDIPTSKL